jgi:protein-tyrosine phosphatase
MNDFEGLDGTFNARDLGGLPLRGGGTTASGVLIRADALHALSPRGVEQLAASPVETIIDFRMGAERDTARDRLPAARRIADVHLPLLEGAMSKVAEEALAAHALGDHTAAGRAAETAMAQLPTLAQMYAQMLEHGAGSFADVARRVADGRGAVLIHCTAGKDRTGVCAAVLLDAVGVEREAIVADYAESERNLAGAWFERMAGMLTMMGLEITPPLTELMAGSPPAAIEAALSWLDDHGGAAAYLGTGGLTDDDLDRLRSRLTPGR